MSDNIATLDELRRELTRLSGIDFTSLTAVRQELERRGGNTSTPGIRGDARRETLEVRLKTLLEKQGVPLYIQPKNVVVDASSDASANTVGRAAQAQVQHVDAESVNWNSLMSIKTALERLQKGTRTPGLKGDQRRDALAERLKSAISVQQGMFGLGEHSSPESSPVASPASASTKRRESSGGTTLGPPRGSAHRMNAASAVATGAGLVAVEAPSIPKLDLGLFKVPVAPYRGPGFGPKPPPQGPSVRLLPPSLKNNSSAGTKPSKPTNPLTKHKQKVAEFEERVERAREQVKELVARREAWLNNELTGDPTSDFTQAYNQLREMKSELHRTKRHKRRFIDSSMVRWLWCHVVSTTLSCHLTCSVTCLLYYTSVYSRLSSLSLTPRCS